MIKINWKVRSRSPQFWIGMVGVVASPVLAYFGLSYKDLTTWDSVSNVFMQFVRNPYLIGTVAVAVLSALGVITDPTTKGITDSNRSMAYEYPKDDYDYVDRDDEDRSDESDENK